MIIVSQFLVWVCATQCVRLDINTHTHTYVSWKYRTKERNWWGCFFLFFFRVSSSSPLLCRWQCQETGANCPLTGNAVHPEASRARAAGTEPTVSPGCSEALRVWKSLGWTLQRCRAFTLSRNSNHSSSFFSIKAAVTCQNAMQNIVLQVKTIRVRISFKKNKNNISLSKKNLFFNLFLEEWQPEGCCWPDNSKW